MQPKLIFIFSQPRSGSTLLQRHLAAHPEICSIPEPWILLPHLFHLQENGQVTQYGHKVAHKAVTDFLTRFPNGEKDYFAHLRNFFLSLYGDIARRNKFFLDKTPRYYFIIPHIYELFPDAKFIFLFRNPLSVFSSIMNTWSEGSFKWIYKFHSDLYLGPKYLTENYEKMKKYSLKINYEMLVQTPEIFTQEVLNYIGVDSQYDILNRQDEKIISGKMGDKIGPKVYSKIETKSLSKWKNSFNTPFRKKIARKYLDEIGDDVLLKMGYSPKELYEDLSNVKPTQYFSFRDRINYFFSVTMAKRNSIKNKENSNRMFHRKTLFPFS